MILQQSKYLIATIDTLKPLGVILFSLVTMYLLFFSGYFKITELKCVQDLGGSCTNDFVQAELKSHLGQNLFRMSDTLLRSRILSGDPTVRELTINKILPHTLSLSLQSVYSTVGLTTSGNTNTFVLDSSYRVIRIVTTNPHVPVLIYDRDLALRVGQVIDDQNLLKILKATLTLSQAFPPSDTVRLRGEVLQFDLDSQRTALFTLTRDLDEQIAALRSLRNNATIPEGTVEIDVRYTQPVLRDKSSL